MTSPTKPSTFEELLKSYDRIRNSEPEYSDYSRDTIDSCIALRREWEATLAAARSALTEFHNRAVEEARRGLR